jgi:glucose/arabinose dehydrogenase/cytochrome c551/c552
MCYLRLNLLLCVCLIGFGPRPTRAEEGKHADVATNSPWAAFVEQDFPFFSSVVDARSVGQRPSEKNLVPRGLVIRISPAVWACFDTELLRVACVWRTEPGSPPVNMVSLAAGSYHIAGQKTKDGQENLPVPQGRMLHSSPVVAGWKVGQDATREDPRTPAPDSAEVGKGPLPDASFRAIKRTAAGVVLHYTVGDCEVEERLQLSSTGQVQRLLKLGASTRGLTLTAAPKPVFFAASAAEQSYTVTLAKTTPDQPLPSWQPWPEQVTTQGELTASENAFTTDVIPLPVPNPWKRNVRLADIAFLNDKGDAAAVTFDGDVWRISGLKGELSDVKWSRFTSGLHEPMSIECRDGEWFVFDRNGISRLVDADQDGTAETHELFCNLFSQTAESREFPNSLKLGPKGEFFLAKGGQEGTTRGKHNGTVIKVSADGRRIEVLGYGLRQPFIGVHPVTGMVTASDQQGHYVPSTPLHEISGGQFYGHLPTIAKKEVYPEAITEPVAWLPHSVNPSGVSQVWLIGAQMGPLTDELLHIGYNRPELFRVLWNTRFKKPQAAVTSFTRDLPLSPLNAKVNPADGQLYVTGFQVWGTTAKELSGLARIRYQNKPRVLVKEVTPMDQGVLLRFNTKLEAKLAADPANFSVERWNYRRTPDYGSPHLKLDGSNGQEWMTASSAYLSQDGLTVFVGIPDMKAGVHQMRIGWGLKSADGLKAENTAYFSPWELARFDSQAEGFGQITVDLTPRKTNVVAASKATAEEGERLSQMYGCIACHSLDGTTVGKVGPSWKGLYGSMREIAKGDVKQVKADDAYLREAILDPAAKVVKGFEKFDTGMPIYAGALTDSQIDSLILYIRELK